MSFVSKQPRAFVLPNLDCFRVVIGCLVKII
jgi:hypothetical protein